MNDASHEALVQSLWYEAARSCGEDPIETLHRFEALVRADAREGCAKQLDALGCHHCAAALRSTPPTGE